MLPARIDLNLIRVFVTIYETGSVSAAARRLFLTQPTISHSLARLRELLQDPLFVRTQAGMAPTPCGDRTYQEFSEALSRIESAIEATRHFEPSTANRRFRLAMSDIGELIFLPPLLARVRAEAPMVELEVTQIPVGEIAAGLADGKIDAAIGNLPFLCAQARHTDLFQEHYVCLMQKEHPAIGDGIDLEQFSNAHHVQVTSNFTGHRMIDDALREHGVKRKIALQIPHFTILPNLIAHSDLLVMLPSRVADLYKRYGEFKSFVLPVALPSFTVRLFWHERHEAHSAQRWLRGAIQSALCGL